MSAQPSLDGLEERSVAFSSAVLQAGFTKIPNVVLRNSALSVQARLVYALLAHYAWHGPECWPGQERLAEEMGLTDRSIRTYLKELQVAGLLTITRRGLGQTNLYRLHLPDLERQPAAAPSGDRLPIMKTQPEEDSVEEESTPLHAQESAIAAVFDAWVQAAQPARTHLTESHRRVVQKILRETRDVDYALRVVRGLAAHQRDKDKRPQLSAVYPYPGSASFSDRVDYFASQCPDDAADTASAPAEPQAPVHLLGALQRVWDADGDSERKRRDTANLVDLIGAEGFTVIHDAGGRPEALRASN